jgi:hypothetical protein
MLTTAMFFFWSTGGYRIHLPLWDARRISAQTFAVAAGSS